jgi:hypothetical protein
MGIDEVKDFSEKKEYIENYLSLMLVSTDEWYSEALVEVMDQGSTKQYYGPFKASFLKLFMAVRSTVNKADSKLVERIEALMMSQSKASDVLAVYPSLRKVLDSSGIYCFGIGDAGDTDIDKEWNDARPDV